MISLGKWKTGSIVPSAKKLSDILSVSKTTVVKCMNLLIKEGLIESQGQLGYSVTNKYESIKLRSKSQFDILKLAKINIDIATRLSMGSEIIDNYVVSIDKTLGIVTILDTNTYILFNRDISYLLDILNNPIKINLLLKSEGSKFVEMRKKFDDQLKFGKVAQYVYKEMKK